jgi:hypothetical protein
LFGIGLVLRDEVVGSARDVVADIMRSQEFAALQGVEGGEGLVTFHDGWLEGEGGGVLALPLKVFSAADGDAREVLASLKGMMGVRREALELVTGPLRTTLSKPDDADGGAIILSCL